MRRDGSRRNSKFTKLSTPAASMPPLAAPPTDFLAANGFTPGLDTALPFSGRRYHVGPAGPALPAPGYQVITDRVDGDRHRVELRLLPAHPGDDLTLHLPDGVEKASVRVEGEALSDSRWPWWHVVTSIATPASGVTIAFEAPANAPWVLYLVGESRGLPPAVADSTVARDAIATPIHGGDRTAGWRKLEMQDLR